MNLAFDLLLSVVDSLMVELAVQAAVGLQCFGMNSGAGSDILTDMGLQRGLAGSGTMAARTSPLGLITPATIVSSITPAP